MAFFESRQSDRLAWASLPASVRSGVGDLLGSPVVAAVDRVGGFSPGVAAGVTLADGRRAFVKAAGVGSNPDTLDLYRREAAIDGWVPAVPWRPAALGLYVDDAWVALAFEYVDAPTVPVPWSEADVATVAAFVRGMHAELGEAHPAAPSVPVALGYDDPWRRWVSSGPPAGAPAWAVAHLDRLAALEGSFAAAADGASLLHMDLRHDNLLLRGADVWVVDWPWVARGAAWVDALLLALTVELYGGPPAPSVFAACVAEPVPVESLAPVLAGACGFFVSHAVLPAPPGLPYLRPAQARQGDLAAAWLDTLRLW